MLDIVFWVFIGAFIGWHFPEPFWAKLIKNKITDWLNRQDIRPPT
jgi:hypothetical protein